jgi:alanyl-tRNA synthetase
VAQKGSLVEPNRLRFDFSHPKPISDAEIAAVEDLANEIILQDDEVTTRLMSVDDAIASGALALFGEKYGDEVRVVSMGRRSGSHNEPKTYSVELCGGTHVRRTGEIGLVKVVTEGAVAAGVRRIEALTGPDARAYLDTQDRRVREAAEILKTTPAEVTERVKALVDERRRLERELADARRKLAMGGGTAGGGNDGISQVGDVKVMARALTGINPKDLRGLVDDGKKALGSGIVAIVGVSDEGKAAIAVGVTSDLTGAHNAVELVRAGAAALGGQGGGGRPDMAQAGGPDGSKAEAALDAVRQAIDKVAAG